MSSQERYGARPRLIRHAGSPAVDAGGGGGDDGGMDDQRFKALEGDMRDVRERVIRIEVKLEGVDERFDGVDRRLDQFELQVNQRFDHVDENFTQKFDQLDEKFTQKFDQLDEKFTQKFDQLDEKFTQKFDQLDEKFNLRFDQGDKQFHQGFNYLSQRFDLTDKRMDTLATKDFVRAEIMAFQNRLILWIIGSGIVSPLVPTLASSLKAALGH